MTATHSSLFQETRHDLVKCYWHQPQSKRQRNTFINKPSISVQSNEHHVQTCKNTEGRRHVKRPLHVLIYILYSHTPLTGALKGVKSPPVPSQASTSSALAGASLPPRASSLSAYAKARLAECCWVEEAWTEGSELSAVSYTFLAAYSTYQISVAQVTMLWTVQAEVTRFANGCL